MTPAGVHTVTVYVRDLPVEFSDESLKCAFSVYGDVYSVRHACYKGFPDLYNGNRLLLMSVQNPSRRPLMFLALLVVPGTPVNLSNVAFVKFLCRSALSFILLLISLWIRFLFLALIVLQSIKFFNRLSEKDVLVSGKFL